MPLCLERYDSVNEDGESAAIQAQIIFYGRNEHHTANFHLAETSQSETTLSLGTTVFASYDRPILANGH